MSSANDIRLDTHNDGGTAAMNRDKLREQLTFAGIASNAARFDPDGNHNEETFATQFGGLCTIVNTGKEDIYAGDFVLWDLPEDNAKPNQWKHAPKSKALFVTKKFTFNQRDDADSRSLMQKVDALLSGNADKKAAKIIALIQEAHFDTTRRCIGRAMSSAKPNDSFDILLGNYCA